MQSWPRIYGVDVYCFSVGLGVHFFSCFFSSRMRYVYWLCLVTDGVF